MLLGFSERDGVPKGIRTPVSTVKGWCPGPLDDGDRTERKSKNTGETVEFDAFSLKK